MIIKSMSRKHPSFSQLIDYIESESKLKSRRFSVFHNVYNRENERLKHEFFENAKHLKFRKNGVYLYHEVISITRTRNIDEDQQKAVLQKIVLEYLRMRAKNNLAYGVLHEDKKDNLHFHIIISANEAEDTTRKRLTKTDFAQIQTRLEKWVLETHPELNQKAVFYPNQTDQERQERERKAHTSNNGAELKRRTGQTTTRDSIKATLEDIFSNAEDGREFTELLNKAGLNLYQRGKQYGIIDQDGTKYRFSTLGLTEEWEALDKRMMDKLNSQRTHQDSQRTQKTAQDTPQPQQKREQDSMNEHTEQGKTQAKTSTFEQVKEALKTPINEDTNSASIDPKEAEIKRRLEEMEEIRKARANSQDSTSHKNQSS